MPVDMPMRRGVPGAHPEQERIVQFGDGPVIVIAGRGDRQDPGDRRTGALAARHQGQRQPRRAGPARPGGTAPSRRATGSPRQPPSQPPRTGPPRSACGRSTRSPPEPACRQPSTPLRRLKPAPIDPFAGRLLPEQILVLTYNVKAARELQDRLDQAVGPAVRARMTVSNFHSFCHQVLSDAAAEAGLPAHPDVLDGVGQMLLLRDLEPGLDLLYHAGCVGRSGRFVQFINRAKDELVTPGRVRCLRRPSERAVFEARYGLFEAAHRPARGSRATSSLPARGPQGIRQAPPVRARRGTRRRADRRPPAGSRQGRRPRGPPDGPRHRRRPERQACSRPSRARRDRARWRRPTSIDGAALEIVRLEELARVYRAYEAELVRRGALDFGEQIAAVSDALEGPARTSCAAGSASSGTSWSTSSRTPTSPRSS